MNGIKSFLKQAHFSRHADLYNLLIKNGQIRKIVPPALWIRGKNTATKEEPQNSCGDPSQGGETADQSFAKAMPFSQIPGPGGLRRVPYIGTLFLFKPFTKYTIETFRELACEMHVKYGSVFRLRLGKNYTVHTCNVEDIERIFSQEPKYPLRRLMELSRVYRERNGLPQGLTSCSGEEWHRMRKPMNLVLKRRQAVLSYLPALEKVAEEFAERLSEVTLDEEDITSSAAEMEKLFFRFGSESVGVVCFNDRLGFLDPGFDQCPEKKKLLEAFKTYISCIFKAVSGVERRYLKTENDPFYKLYERNITYIKLQATAYVNRVIKSSKDSLNNNDASSGSTHDDDNLLLSLLRRRDLNMEEILANIESMLIAGSESTARVLSVLLYDMAMHPDIQARVAAEVMAHAGQDGPITADIIDNLRLVKACVKESMRLHYPVSTGVERTVTRDTVVSGYQIPAGTSIIMTGARTSQDPDYFPDPLAFKPERWLKDRSGQDDTTEAGQIKTGSRQIKTESGQSNIESIQIKTESGQIKTEPGPDTGLDSELASSAAALTRESRLSAFAFIPFGHGARSCVGSNFAKMELEVGLARIVQKLNISVHPSYGELKLRYTPFITPVEPIPFMFSRR